MAKNKIGFQATLDTKKFQSSTDKMKSSMKSLGAVGAGGLGGIKDALSKLPGPLKLLGVGVGAATAAFTALNKATEFVNQIAGDLDTLNKSAVKVGLSAQALKEFHIQAELSGISVGQADTALNQFSIRLLEAQQNQSGMIRTLGEQNAAMAALAEKWRIYGTTAEVAMGEAFVAIRNMSHETDKANAVQKLFGQGVAKSLLPLIETYDATGDSLERIISAYDGDLISSMESMNDQTTIHEQTLKAIDVRMSSELIPLTSKWQDLSQQAAVKWAEMKLSIVEIILSIDGIGESLQTQEETQQKLTDHLVNQAAYEKDKAAAQEKAKQAHLELLELYKLEGVEASRIQEAAEKLAAANEAASQIHLSNYKIEVEVKEEAAGATEQLAEVQTKLNTLKDEAATKTDKQTKASKKLTIAQIDLANGHVQAAKNFQDFINELNHVDEIIEAEQAILNLQRALDTGEVNDPRAALKKIEGLREELDSLNKIDTPEIEIEPIVDEVDWKDTVKEMGGALKEALSGSMTGAEVDFKKVLDGMAKSILKSEIKKSFKTLFDGMIGKANELGRATRNATQGVQTAPAASSSSPALAGATAAVGGGGFNWGAAIGGVLTAGAVAYSANRNSGGSSGGGPTNITINVKNNTGSNSTAEVQNNYFDGGEQIIDVVINDYNQGGRTRQTFG